MSITNKVKSFYSKHTYPNYPILASPLWQYGYLGSAYFSGFLFESVFGTSSSIFRYDVKKSYTNESNCKNILIVGSGEILPYVSRKFEPRSHRIYCVDLSGSSLKRARLRLALSLNTKPIYFIEDDINHFLDTTDLMFDHVDCFGVLHHLDSPSLTLKKISSHLKPQGTCRIMVYNYPARWWIHSLASIFKLCGYSYNSYQDIQSAKDWIYKLKKLYPNSILTHYLDSVGGFLLDNSARFSDTFLHPREIRYDIPRWFKLFLDSGLTPFGMNDRYQELTDIYPDLSSLYAVPDPSTLLTLSKNGYFLGNLELYLTRSDTVKKIKPSSDISSSSSLKDYPFSVRVFIFLRELLFHLLRSSPFRQAGKFKRKLWTNWIVNILFTHSVSNKISQDLDFIKQGYLFPVMLPNDLKSSMINSIKKKNKLSTNQELTKSINPTQFSYIKSKSISKDMDYKSLDNNELLPKSFTLLSPKKQSEIKRRLIPLLTEYKDNC